MQIDQMLGDYRLLKLVGKGGQGVVYKAFDTKLKRIVGIKIFTAKDEKRKQKLASFKYEARLASALDHPNICTIYALFEDDEHTYIVMEYVEGKNLYEFAHYRPLELRSALKIIIQVTDALMAAHARHIIHRDIKPRNVMVTNTGRVIVLDFGLAKLMENSDGNFDDDPDDLSFSGEMREALSGDIVEDLTLTVEGVAMGTSTSSAPELAVGRPSDHRADIFSTGVLLYLLLTGDYPFLGKTKTEVRDKIINKDPVPVSLARKTGKPAPPRLAAIVDRCLQKDPDDRFQSMAGLRQELLEALGEIENEPGTEDGEYLPALPDPDTLWYAPPRPRKNRQRVTVMITLAAALLLLVILIYFCFF